MITRFVIEGILVLAVIVGFVFEEKIALAERRLLKKIFARSFARKEREENMKLKLREARYLRQQKERELELLELGLDPRPSLKIIGGEKKSKLVSKQEVA